MVIKTTFFNSPAARAQAPVHPSPARSSPAPSNISGNFHICFILFSYYFHIFSYIFHISFTFFSYFFIFFARGEGGRQPGGPGPGTELHMFFIFFPYIFHTFSILFSYFFHIRGDGIVWGTCVMKSSKTQRFLYMVC